MERVGEVSEGPNPPTRPIIIHEHAQPVRSVQQEEDILNNFLIILRCSRRRYLLLIQFIGGQGHLC